MSHRTINLESSYNTKDYLTNCFFYIHDNPLTANLVTDLSQWPYSSWPDYYGLRNGTLCNIEEAMNQIGFREIDFKNTGYQRPDKNIISSLW